MESQPPSTNMKGCKVCFNPYDCNERRPRSLPCGHTFCSKCISDNLKENKVICPSCRGEHEASASTDFPVNFELENFMLEDQTSGQQDTLTVSNLSGINASRGISKGLELMKHQFTNNIEGLRANSQEACSQLHEYKSHLLEWRKQHKDNLEEHRIIVYQSEDMIKRIDKETLRVDETLEEGKEKGRNIKTASNDLSAASAAHEVTSALNEADFCYLVLDKWNKGVKKHFPDNELVTDSKKLKERSKYCLLKTSCCLDQTYLNPKASTLVSNQCQNVKAPSSKEEASNDEPAEDKIGPLSSTIQGRLHKLIDMSVQMVILTAHTHISLELEVQDLIPMIPMVKSGVYAVKKDEDKGVRYAKVTHDQDKLYLHVLSNTQNVPQDALLLQHDDVMKLVDPSSRLTFLELGVDGRSLGRLMIRLSPDTKSAQQFSILCTGEMGPSYTDNNIRCVCNKGDDEKEYVRFGDYEWNGRSGGKAILPGVDWEKERNNEVHVRPLVVGSVGNSNYNEENAARFVIYTRDRPNKKRNGIFGIVEDGMSILTEVVSNYPDIKKCFIRDSGIVLNL